MAEEMRLQKYLALCGVASRRTAETMILDGRVAVNGVVCDTLGTKVDPARDSVALDGKTVSQAEEKVYILLHKPAGVVTTAKDNFDRETVLDLVPSSLGRIHPVGRLDYDTEGLLLLTNDGDLTNRLTHPRHEISKTYLATVAGFPNADAVSSLRRGVIIDGRKTRPAYVVIGKKTTNTTDLFITIHEGRNRQVRKMCAAVGHAAVRLVRISEGPVSLGNLPVGQWRHLTADEVSKLKG